mgnify:FL=1
MGISGMFLRKITNERLSLIKKEIIDILESLSYNYYDWNENLKGENYCSISVDYNECGFIMYLYELQNSKENWHINWIDNNLTEVVIIEDIKYSEMILEILHKYMQIHPDTIYYTEMDWYYTKEDIDKIYVSNDNIHWKYKTMKSNIK